MFEHLTFAMGKYEARFPADRRYVRSHMWSRRLRRADDLAEATRADANMLVLHHPVLLETDEAIDQVADCVCKLSSWAEAIK